MDCVVQVAGREGLAQAGGRVKPAAHRAGRDDGEHQDGGEIGQHRHHLRGHADPAHALDVELEDGHAAEQVGAGQEPHGLPGGEHDQSQGDPAAARGHVLDPHRRVGERQERPAQASAQSAEQDGQVADLDDVVADRVGRDVAVATGPQDHAAAGALEEPGDADGQRHGQVDQGVLSEQHRSQHRNGRETGDRQLGQRLDRRADEGVAEQGAQAQAEQSEGKTGGDLVADQGQGEHAEDERHQHTGDRGRQDTRRVAAGGEGDGEGGDRSRQHHALDAEIEHTRALDHQLADAGEQERGGGADDGDQDRDRDLEAHAGATSRRAGV